ncbi:GntR family transcriptional regulator [Nonomuraea sp. NPDC050328]|uniref:GntR family transcriptional regulator n=1 Tax=Nonomuraea sp. NPDC050328 TaxID=3364361 RepID=UPI0037BC1E7E
MENDELPDGVLGPSEDSIWRVIASALRADILEGHYAPGSPLPSETQLASRYSVSRPTVRQALKNLVLEGLVTIVRGRGTFVRTVPDRFLILLGAEPRPDLVDLAFNPINQSWGWLRVPIPGEHDGEGGEVYGLNRTIPANREVAAMLGTRLGHKINHRFNVWMHVKKRFIEVNSYTNTDVIPPPTKDKRGRVQAQLAPFYERIQADRGPIEWFTTVTARMPYETERLRLHLEVGAPILLIRRVMFSKDGQPLEATEIKAAAEEFETASIVESASDTSGVDDDGEVSQMSPDGPVVLML